MKNPKNRSIAEYIQQWGNSASIALLNPLCSIFSIPSIDGIIGYRLESQCAVIFGDPVCSLQDMPHLVQAFHDHVKHDAKSIVYTVTSEQFTEWALKEGLCKCAASIGDEIILDPLRCDPTILTGKNARSLRNKLVFSMRQGITVHEYHHNDASLEQALHNVKESWLDKRSGPQVCFFPHIDLFADSAHKRYFYACYNGAIVAVAMLNRLDNHQGWVLNMLMKTPDAPTTTSEFLIMSILETLRQEGCSFFSIGTTPAPHIGRTEGFSACYDWLIRTSFKIVNKILKLGGRQRYWEKFEPTKSPTFIMTTRSKIGLREALGIGRAFNASL